MPGVVGALGVSGSPGGVGEAWACRGGLWVSGLKTGLLYTFGGVGEPRGCRGAQGVSGSPGVSGRGPIV
jgi:hypothetical protein